MNVVLELIFSLLKLTDLVVGKSVYEGKYLLEFIKFLFLRYFEFNKLFVSLVIELQIG